MEDFNWLVTKIIETVECFGVQWFVMNVKHPSSRDHFVYVFHQMKAKVTLSRRLPLAGHIHKMVPEPWRINSFDVCAPTTWVKRYLMMTSWYAHDVMTDELVVLCAGHSPVNDGFHSQTVGNAYYWTFQGNPPVTDGFHSQRVSNVGFWFYFAVSIYTLLNKHSQRYETPWNLCDVTVMCCITDI